MVPPGPETEAREVAMAAEERGRTPGRWPTCTAYCDRLTATIGSASPGAPAVEQLREMEDVELHLSGEGAPAAAAAPDRVPGLGCAAGRHAPRSPCLTQPQATETAARNGGNGNGGVGRVGGKEIDGGKPHGKKKEINRGKKVKESSLGHNIIKEKYQKVDKANEIDGGELHPVKNKEIHRGKKLNESPLGRTIIKKVDKVKEKQMQVSQKPISEKSKNNKSASPRPPIQVTRSPGVNFLVWAASVKNEAVKRANLGGSPSTPQPPSQNQFGSPSLQDVSPDTRATISQASKRKRRKLISDIWAEAEPIYKDGKLVEGKCIHCHQIFAAGREIGTSHMKRHLKVCDAKASMSEIVAKMGCPDGIDRKNWKFNVKHARRTLLKMVVINEMPFSFVEYTSFREFTAALNPYFENISRTTIKNDCIDAFKYHGDQMKEEFKNSVSRISLTGDMWTSNQKLGYFCQTAHFITDDWELHKYIIRFAMMEAPHNSVNMFNLVLNSLQEWNLEDKLFSFTLDNASVNIAMVNSLRTNLKKKGFLVLEGKLLHFRCATHVFNLIVQDGLRVIKSVVNNIRESVKFVRSSQSRVEKFVKIIIQEGLSPRNPCPDVTSRWNSTFLMLESALPLRNVFLSLEIQDKEYTFAPLNSEWELAEAVMKVLEVFYTATNTLSGSKYPTSHLYFYQLWKIKKMLNTEQSTLNRKILKKEASSQDVTVAHMIEQMQTKFNQYWKETYMSACIPVILDPRYKYDLLEYLLIDFGTEKEAQIMDGRSEE